MTNTGGAALVFCLALAGLCAQNTGGPTIDQILDRYVQARGGQAAIEKAATRVIQGVMESPDEGTSSPLEIHAKAPDRFLLTVNVEGYGVVQEALNGSKGWSKNPDSGLRDMSGQDLAAAQRNFAFLREIRLKLLYPKMSLAGKANLPDGEAHVIEATPAQGATERLYFDVKTGLLVRRDYEQISFDEGITPWEVTFDDYRDVDGVRLPFFQRRKTPDYSLIYKYSEVKTNVPIDDSQFDKPAK